MDPPMELDFHGYHLLEVWQKTTPDQCEEVSRFWLKEGALHNANQARERTQQLVTLVRDLSGALAGVSTAYVAGLGNTEIPHYFFRMFINTQNRRHMLAIRVALFSRDILKKRTPAQAGSPAGIVHVNENPKLMRPGIKRKFIQHGYHLLGKSTAGHEVWRFGFDTSEPV